MLEKIYRGNGLFLTKGVWFLQENVCLIPWELSEGYYKSF